MVSEMMRKSETALCCPVLSSQAVLDSVTKSRKDIELPACDASASSAGERCFRAHPWRCGSV